jgi:hypothetical protein
MGGAHKWFVSSVGKRSLQLACPPIDPVTLAASGLFCRRKALINCNADGNRRVAMWRKGNKTDEPK